LDGQLSRHWFGRVLITAILLITAIHAVRPMVSYRAIDLGATPFQLGLVAASYALLSLVAAVPIGRWVDRLGEVRFLVSGALVVALIAAVLVGVTSIAGLIVAQALLGVGQILSVVALQSLVAASVGPAARDARFGVFSVAVSAGLIAGPALAGLVGGRGGAGLAHVFWMSSGVALAGTVSAASLWRWPPRRRRSRPPAGNPPTSGSAAVPTALRLSRLPGMLQAMLASLTVLASIDIVVAYLPAYGELHGIAVGTVGLLLATQSATSMTARVLMVRLLRLLGRRRLLASSMIITASSLAVLPLAGADTTLLYLLMGAAGVGLGLAQPITMSWVAGRAPSGERATALGVRLTANRFGQLVLPAAVGVVAGAAGVSAIFVALGALLATSGTVVLRAPFTEDGS
jgi:MFS family permease